MLGWPSWNLCSALRHQSLLENTVQTCEVTQVYHPDKHYPWPPSFTAVLITSKRRQTLFKPLLNCQLCSAPPSGPPRSLQHHTLAPHAPRDLKDHLTCSCPRPGFPVTPVSDVALCCRCHFQCHRRAQQELRHLLVLRADSHSVSASSSGVCSRTALLCSPRKGL